MKIKYLINTVVLSMLLVLGCLAQTNSPTLISVNPTPVLAPSNPGQAFTGTFTISGTNLQNGEIYTDGPLGLIGSSTVSADGTTIQRNYQIGCCAPQEGQRFNLFVATPNGQASISTYITKIVPLPTLTGVNPKPILQPATPGPTLTGTFTITGRNLQGGEIYTDGYILLEGASTVSADGTSIQRNYRVWCCQLQEGQPFNLFVVTPYGRSNNVSTFSTRNLPLPTISSVDPTPVYAPSIVIEPFTGTFTITGTNLRGGTITTDGPLALLGPSAVSADGTTIQRNYQIGCCAPQEGQRFNLFVTNSYGQTSVSATITLVKPSATMMETAFNLIPDYSFANNNPNRRNTLLNKLSVIKEQIAKGNSQGAIEKLTNDLRPHVEDWVLDNYSKESNEQLTKPDLLRVIDALITSLQ